jgi:hypothetical protein
MPAPEKAWYVPADAIWEDPYWILPVLEDVVPEEA